MVSFACPWCCMCFLCLLSSGVPCNWWGLRVCGVLCAFCVCFVLVLHVTSDVCVSVVFYILYVSSEIWCSLWQLGEVCMSACLMGPLSSGVLCDQWSSVYFLCLLSSGVLCDWRGLCVCVLFLCVSWVVVFWCCVWPVRFACLWYSVCFLYLLSSGVLCDREVVFCVVLYVSSKIWCSV